MKLVRVLTALIGEPWLISPAKHSELTRIALAHANGDHTAADEFRKMNEKIWSPEAKTIKDKQAGRSLIQDNGGIVTDKGIAVIPVEGIIGRKFSNVINSSGVVSIDVLDQILKECETREDIRAVVIQFDSPGGSGMGVEDTAGNITALNAKKPCIAFADGLCCSAAYWLASSCSAIYSIKSADIGSIGVYMALLDTSRANETAGIKTNLFKSGKLKATGFPGTSLSDDERAYLQSRVDILYNKFVSNVIQGRAGKKIENETLQGQSFTSDEAIKNGLLDSVATLNQAIDDADKLAKIRGK